MVLTAAIPVYTGGSPDSVPFYNLLRMRLPGRRRRVRNYLPWDADYGGWGGQEYFDPSPERPTPVWTLFDGCNPPRPRDVDQTPIVFVHGQGRTARDWQTPADYFLERGYSGDEIWAITFRHSVPTHEEMADQLDDFISNVLSYTERNSVNIIAHSLGVTGTRYWMRVNNRYEWVDKFISLGGANHGIPLCEELPTIFFSKRQYRVFQFLTSGSTAPTPVQLSDLNEHGPHPDVEYYTISGKYDPVYLGDRTSPHIDGAEENVELPKNHDGIRESEESLRLMYGWIESSDIALDVSHHNTHADRDSYVG